MVVKLDEESASAWHDLALSSFHFGMVRNWFKLNFLNQSQIRSQVTFAKTQNYSWNAQQLCLFVDIFTI